ncbi:myb-like transcription factor family protein [Actinidia rufa]|uniref:Myb-like transcription factor family protein n=1 Tax=Actinidia rufa TaxID=165716 RepID=A0A7J0EJ70_9ERIC|nr:myb-like transcription factor family protein [Actinidia rufa]
MGANSSELNLDLGSIYAPKTISEIRADVSETGDVSEKSSKLNGFVRVLEDELTKIHAFKPITKLKEGGMQSERIEIRPVTEEFVALKDDYVKGEGAKVSIDLGDKKDWMSSARLWSTSKVKCENNYADLKNQFSGQSGLRMEPVAEMGLNLEGKSGSSGSGSSSVTDQMKPPNKANQQEKKRQRRSWSPELHRRFVDALEQLGGAQTATPKHIRELMEVDGLTNDEVKSHLQKYRIHVQKLQASSVATSTGL